MPSSDWRSPAAYGYAHSIPAAGFAWEYLRRDDAYRHDFQRLKRTSHHDTEARTTFSNRWGCDFAADPDQPADRASIFWAPALQPDDFRLQPSSDLPGDFAMPIVLPGLTGLAARSAEDGAWHGLWRGSSGEHRFWLPHAPPDGPTSFVVILPLDTLFELRAEAALRFWLALAGRPPGDRRHDLPPQTRDRHVLVLRALDAKLAGASYRVIAEALLGFRGRSKNDWEVSPLKNRARRLVADGLAYMRGGYRELLRYPVRARRQ